jgi:hypothetical protein
MAATLAGLIRGRDVVEDAQALKMVASAQLDVDLFAFDDVIAVLEAAEFVQGVKRLVNKILSSSYELSYCPPALPPWGGLPKGPSASLDSRSDSETLEDQPGIDGRI